MIYHGQIRENFSWFHSFFILKVVVGMVVSLQSGSLSGPPLRFEQFRMRLCGVVRLYKFLPLPWKVVLVLFEEPLDELLPPLYVKFHRHCLQSIGQCDMDQGIYCYLGITALGCFVEAVKCNAVDLGWRAVCSLKGALLLEKVVTSAQERGAFCEAITVALSAERLKGVPYFLKSGSQIRSWENFMARVIVK
jgi:hypothetical protein